MKPWVLTSIPVLKDSLKTDSVMLVSRESRIVRELPLVLTKVVLLIVIPEEVSIEIRGGQMTPEGQPVVPSSSKVMPSMLIFEEPEMFKSV